MESDERLVLVRNDIMANGFRLLRNGLLVVILYRQFYLGQSPPEYIDFAALVFLVSGYVGVRSHIWGTNRPQAERGSFMPWPWWRFGLFFVWVALFSYLRGRLDTLGGWLDLGLTVVMVAPIILAFWYLLDRVWKKRSGLDEDDG